MDLSWTLVVLGAIVLVAYVFDFIGKRLRVPAVVLLIFVGIALRAGADFSGFSLSLPNALLPVLGTLGLILIVLEGALDISLTREHIGLVGRTFLCATLGILLTGALLTYALMWLYDATPLQALLHAGPFTVISSSVAIPAAVSLSKRLREFIVYESSLSDIVGVILFSALLRNDNGVGFTALHMSGEIALSVVVGVIAALAIFWLIQRIDHHVRVLPMIFGLTMMYGAGKLLHLAPLMLVVLVGLLLNNSFLIERLTRRRLAASDSFERDLDAFKHLTAEFTFVVRSFFFVLLGFSTPVSELMHPSAWLLAIVIMACSLLPRAPLMRWVAREKSRALLYFAPRGLITVLLFLSIPGEYAISGFPKAALMIVILMWAAVLTWGAVRADGADVADDAETGVATEAGRLDAAPVESTQIQNQQT